MLEATTKYALEALLYLAEQDSDDYVRIDTLAKRIEVPGPYLSKIMQSLASRGIVITKKGAKGGVKLAQGTKEITFLEVCKALEDPIVGPGCMLRKGLCNKNKPCQFHADWTAMKQQLATYFVKLRVSKAKKGEYSRTL